MPFELGRAQQDPLGDCCVRWQKVVQGEGEDVALRVEFGAVEEKMSGGFIQN